MALSPNAKTLSAERLHALLRYDPTTGLFTRIVAPGKRGDLLGATAGSPQHQGYILIAVDGRKYKAHRLAWLYMTGAWPAGAVDHINQVKDDNRWSNLREATKAQNEQNKPVRPHNSSGATGVYWNKAASKWQAYITVSGENLYLGIFADKSAAIAARRAAEDKHFGAFAYRGAA